MPAKPRRAKILPLNRPKAASATAPTAHTSEAIVRTRDGAGRSKYSAPAAQAMRSAAIRLAKLIKTKRTARMKKRGPRPRLEEGKTALGIQRLRFSLFIQLDCNPFMRFWRQTALSGQQGLCNWLRFMASLATPKEIL